MLSFERKVERIFATVVDALDRADLDGDIEHADGTLTIRSEDSGETIVLSRHTLNQEVWIAARSGGFHFRLLGDAWVDTRSGEPLETVLGRLLSQAFGTTLVVKF